ncbi:Os06g0154900, partial [Oryza sativa Japonica Group]
GGCGGWVVVGDGESGGREEEAEAGGGGEVHEAAGAVPAPGHRPQEAAPPHRRGQARPLLPRLRRPPRRPRGVSHLLPVLPQPQPVQVLRQGNLHGVFSPDEDAHLVPADAVPLLQNGELRG